MMQQIKSLLQIKSIDDIESFKVTHMYTDDHQQCAHVEINGIEVEFLWYDELGFCYYYKESPKAAATLIQAIHTAAVMMAEDIEQEYDEELKSLIEPHI